MTRLPCILILSAVALGQPQSDPKLSFDAASVKFGEQLTGFLAPVKSSNPGRSVYRNYTLKRLVVEAYELADYQVEAPPWIARERYDLIVTKPRGTTPDQARLMMRSLLAERFHLVMHNETKELPAYMLLPGRDRSKLRPETNAPQVPGCKSFGTMSEFADVLAHNLGKPVADQTGIPGSFYFILAYSNSLATADGGPPGIVPPPPPPPAAPPPCPGWTAATMSPLASNIFDAVREQMGLKLERRGTASVSLFVIDHADKAPQPN